MNHKLLTENWRKFIKEDCWDGYVRDPEKAEGTPGSCTKKTNEAEEEQVSGQQETPEGCNANAGCRCVDSSVNIPVVKIQQFLANKYGKELMPKTFESGNADGLCGTETRMMIMKYQSENKLKCDACVGTETGASMFPDMDLEAAPVAAVASKTAAGKEAPKSVAVDFTTNQDFPLINGRNLILPIEGKNNAGHADWDQLRGKESAGVQALHAAIDVFVPTGTPIIAVADGTIVMSNEAQHNNYVNNMVNLINKRIEQNELINDVNTALGATIKRYSRNAKRKDWAGKVYRMRVKNLQGLNDRFPDGRYTGPPPPAAWPDLSIWGINNLTPKAMSNLLRHYKKTQGLRFPLGGMGLTLRTDPDQFGNTWKFYGGHCSKILVPKGRVKAGDVIALVGDTALFDAPGKNDHLHYSIGVVSDSSRKIANSPTIRFAGNRSIDPRRVIPAYTGGVAGVYAGSQA